MNIRVNILFDFMVREMTTKYIHTTETDLIDLIESNTYVFNVPIGYGRLDGITNPSVMVGGNLFCSPFYVIFLMFIVY